MIQVTKAWKPSQQETTWYLCEGSETMCVPILYVVERAFAKQCGDAFQPSTHKKTRGGPSLPVSLTTGAGAPFLVSAFCKDAVLIFIKPLKAEIADFFTIYGNNLFYCRQTTPSSVFLSFSYVRYASRSRPRRSRLRFPPTETNTTYCMKVLGSSFQVRMIVTQQQVLFLNMISLSNPKGSENI